MESGFYSALAARRVWVTLLLGFSSGLPLLTTLDMLKAWLTDAKVGLTVIGLSGLLGLPYTLKFLWAPFVDRYVPPFLGRRRGWMIITQIALIICIALLGCCDPIESPSLLGICALLVTFFSASQDIVLDAHRRDTLEDRELGIGASLFVTGYRIGMIMSGAVALTLADSMSWAEVYLVMAACMAVGVFATLISPEPESFGSTPSSLKAAVFEPLYDFFKRDGALLILAFVLTYKLGDMIASTMTIPYYKAIGFKWSEIGSIAKIFGLVSMIVGGFIGGAVVYKIGIQRSLWIFGLLQAVGILGFLLLIVSGPNLYALAAVITFENLSIGLATSAFVAFMGMLCNRRFSATQYALLTSLAGVPRTIFGSSSGWLAEQLGWFGFFVCCAVLALPGLYVLSKVQSLEDKL